MGVEKVSLAEMTLPRWNGDCKGGLRIRKVYRGELENVAVPESAADVRRLLGQTMVDVRSGKLDPKIGATIYLANG